jgi:opine dehydrogenase
VREALGYGAPHYPLADHYSNDRWMYGDAHKKLVKSATGASTSTCTPPLRDRRHRAGLAFLASWRAGRRRCADRARPAGRRRRLPRARPAAGPRTLEALGLHGSDRDALQQLLHEGE